MSKAANSRAVGIDRFFAGPGARADQWRNLVELAEGWAGGTKANGAKVAAALGEMTATEEFHAYPGLRLLGTLREHVAANDAAATAQLARRITRNLLTRSFRQHAGGLGGRRGQRGRGGRAAAGTWRRGRTRPSALFRGLDRHRRAAKPLGRARDRMAPPSPTAGRIRVRAGAGRQRRGRVLRRHA